jgi:CCR4-NOT transcription complex subunit 6
MTHSPTTHLQSGLAASNTLYAMVNSICISPNGHCQLTAFCVQVHTLLKGLEKIANSAHIPMIVAGDLNSVPGSAPHVLMMKQHVELSHRDLERDPLSLFTGPSCCGNKLSHSLRLQSAYAAAMQSTQHSQGLEVIRSRLDERFQEPLHTNITADFKAALDYICCSTPELQTTALLELPDVEAMLQGDMSSGLPSATCPSDHIALMAEFEFTS